MSQSLIGNPYAIGTPNNIRIQYTPPAAPDLSRSLAGLIQSQAALLRASRPAGGGGRGMSVEDRIALEKAKAELRANADIAKYTHIVKVPKGDGTFTDEPVVARTDKEYSQQAQALVKAAQQNILNNDAALQKLRADFSSLSAPGKLKALEQLRKVDQPRLLQSTGMSAEDFAASVIAPLEAEQQKYAKEVKQGYIGRNLIDGGIMAFRSLRDAFRSIGASPAEDLAIGKATAEENQRTIESNPYLREQQRLAREGDSGWDYALDNPLTAAASGIARVAPIVLPALIGGPAGLGISAAVGATLGSGEALARVAEDPTLTEQQKLEGIRNAQLAGGAVGAAFGALPGPAMGLRMAASGAARVAENAAAGSLAGRVAGGFAKRVGDRTAPGFWRSTAEHTADNALLGAGYAIGGNAAYNAATGAEGDIYAGARDSALAGAALGLPFGMRAGWRNNRARAAVEATRAREQAQEGTTDTLAGTDTAPPAEPYRYQEVVYPENYIDPGRLDNDFLNNATVAPRQFDFTRESVRRVVPWPRGYDERTTQLTPNAPALYFPETGLSVVPENRGAPRRTTLLDVVGAPVESLNREWRPTGLPASATPRQGMLEAPRNVLRELYDNTIRPQQELINRDMPGVLQRRAEIEQVRARQAQEQTEREAREQAVRAYDAAQEAAFDRKLQRNYAMGQYHKIQDAYARLNILADRIREQAAPRQEAAQMINAQLEATRRAALARKTDRRLRQRGQAPLYSEDIPIEAMARSIKSAKTAKALDKILKHWDSIGILGEDIRAAMGTLSTKSWRRKLIQKSGLLNEQSRATETSGRSEPTPPMGRDGSIRATGTNETNIPANRSVPADTAPVVEPPANTNVEPPVTSSPTPEGRGDAGATPPNPREIETPAPIVGEPQPGRAAAANGESGGGQPAARPAEPDTGQRGVAPADNAGTGSTRDAEPTDNRGTVKPEYVPTETELETAPTRLEEIHDQITDIMDNKVLGDAKVFDKYFADYERMSGDDIIDALTPGEVQRVFTNASIKETYGEKIPADESKIYKYFKKEGVPAVEVNKEVIAKNAEIARAQGWVGKDVDYALRDPAAAIQEININGATTPRC